MKKINITLLLCLSVMVALQAQKAFQGSVTYTYEVEGEDAEQLSGFIPDGTVVMYGDNKVATEIKGGTKADMMMSRVFVNDDKAYFVKDSDQTVYFIDYEDVEALRGQAAEKQPEAEQVKGETKNILGYTCQKYLFTMGQEDREFKLVIWATDAFKAPDMQLPSHHRKDIGSTMLNMGGMNGMPLQVDATFPAMSATLTLKATAIEEGSVPDEVFAKPAGYEEKPFAEMMK